ncbi:sigma factor-like helix-turn-helix DNA-binding protein [Mycoplasma nasistruthionis]|uniref:Sigma-70 family RNA polymerase sigma factor n=1 Tax=Mycoplasma nasistruthionis TaxID=353852 RepID=A0A4Y6I6G1_9MOLU|nr:sigma factor-like helix-turn-helix DNA-binding protein [Mycoplasma nasistruthionis]QCZ36941.1 hypothetical protein FG904_02925 [Mycoplasma nasistruthionis]QDF65214.1 hypothetical protein FIV53_02880 [Mycoplasma nasistruthionis]
MNNRSMEAVVKYNKLFDLYENLLTQNQKQVFKLYFQQDLSYAEIAEIMATTRSAAFDTLKKALAKLDKLHDSLQ